MKVTTSSVLDISALRGALMINPNGGEFYCVGIGVHLPDHAIVVQLADDPAGLVGVVGLAWADMQDWEVELRPYRHPAGT